MTDALMQAIIAAPDDDAPRLVWADREGGERGERGELVVIQCRLARHLPRDERQRLTAREAALLEKNSRVWSGFEGAHFIRGFVERLTISVEELVPNVERTFASAPLLRDLRFKPLAEVDPLRGESVEAAWAANEANLRDLLGRLPPGRVRSLTVSSSIEQLPGPFDELSNSSWSDIHHDTALLELLTNAPSLASLRELVIPKGAIGPEHIPALARLQVERLQLGAHRLNGAGIVRLLREAPTITGLAAWHGNPRLKGPELALFLSCPEVARVKELDLANNDLTANDLLSIADCRALSKLERLGIRVSHAQGIEHIAKSSALAGLRALDISSSANPSDLEGATFKNSLRVIGANRRDAERFFELFPALERVEGPIKAKT